MAQLTRTPFDLSPSCLDTFIDAMQLSFNTSAAVNLLFFSDSSGQSVGDVGGRVPSEEVYRRRKGTVGGFTFIQPGLFRRHDTEYHLSIQGLIR